MSSNGFLIHKTNFKVFLDSIVNLSYRWAVFDESIDDQFECTHQICRKITNNIKHSVYVRKFGIIVVGFELPQFVNELLYSIDGNIVYDDEEENGERRHVSLIIPTIKIAAEDLNNRALFLWPLQNDVRDLIGMMTVYDKCEFVMILSPEWTTSLETTLEIYCSLRKFNNVESSCRLYFIATDISPLFDGIVIEAHKSQTCITTGFSNSFDVKLFSRDNDAVNYLLHHLYKCIKGVLLLTPELYPNYSIMETFRTDEQHSECVREFGECIKKEMKFVHDFLLITSTRRDVELKDVIEFRRKLVNFEFQSDLAYMKARFE